MNAIGWAAFVALFVAFWAHALAIRALRLRLEAVEKVAHAPQALPIGDMERRLDVLDHEMAVLSKGRMGRLRRVGPATTS